MTISKSFTADGFSGALYVRAGESLTYTVDVDLTFDGTLSIQVSKDASNWETLVSGITADVLATTIQNDSKLNKHYRFMCENRTAGQADVILTEAVEDVQTFENNSGDTVAAVTEDGLRTDSLTLGATEVTATGAELNKLDVSAQSETIEGDGGVVSPVLLNTKIDSTTGAGAVTLAAPDASNYGKIKTIEMTVDGGDVTLALTEVVGGTAATTATFANVGETLVLLGGTSKWIVLKEYGVVLS